MGEQKEYAVCKCGDTYRCDGVYAKEACPACLPKLKKYAHIYTRTPEQEAALSAWHARIELDKPAELTAA